MNFIAMSNSAILEEMGRRFNRERLNRNITQAELAHRAGVSRKTIQNLELQGICSTPIMIRILRALDKLDILDSFLPEPGISPMQLAKSRGHPRQRAGRRTGE